MDKSRWSIGDALGVYYPGNSLIHRLQARTKLLIIAWFVIWLIVAHRFYWHFAPSVVVLAFPFGGLLLAGIAPREIWRRIWLIFILLLLGAIPTLFTTEVDRRALYPIGPFLTTYGFVNTTLLIICGALTVLLVASLLPQLQSIRSLLRRVRVLFVLVLLAAMFSLWLLGGSPSKRPLPIGPFIITYGGVWTLQTFFVMLLALYAFSLLLTMTTSPVALIEGLTMFLAPLRKLKLPVDDFALMALLALRFIPTLLEEVEQLMKAQMARGSDLAHGSLGERLQSLIMLFTPMLQAALRRATELATALEARGYQSKGRQTMLHETKLGRIDYTILGIVVFFSLVSLFL